MSTWVAGRARSRPPPSPPGCTHERSLPCGSWATLVALRFGVYGIKGQAGRGRAWQDRPTALPSGPHWLIPQVCCSCPGQGQPHVPCAKPWGHATHPCSPQMPSGSSTSPFGVGRCHGPVLVPATWLARGRRRCRGRGGPTASCVTEGACAPPARPVLHRSGLLGPCRRRLVLSRSLGSGKRAGLDPRAVRAAPCPPPTSPGAAPPSGRPRDRWPSRSAGNAILMDAELKGRGPY